MIESRESFQPWFESPFFDRPVDPRERAFEMGPQLLEQHEIAGSLEVGGRHHRKQRRRVDAAVVALERHLAQRRHLSAAHLVDDLARLGIALGVVRVRLVRREEPQHAARDRRIDPERLERHDQRIAAERRAEPRDTRVRHGPLRGRNSQHREVDGGVADPGVHRVIRRRDLRGEVGPGCGPAGDGIAGGPGPHAALTQRARDLHRDLHALSGRERNDPI
jgi:hypothetical protein